MDIEVAEVAAKVWLSGLDDLAQQAPLPLAEVHSSLAQ
jgi:hypothetical protein